MLQAKLSSERVFRNGEFREVERQALRAEKINIIPTHLRFSKKNNILIGCCPQSRRGDDFSVSKNLLDFLIKMEDTARVGQTYVILFEGERDQENVVYQITAKELRQRLRDAILLEGDYGEYWWVNEEGQPTGGSRPKGGGDSGGYPELPF